MLLNAFYKLTLQQYDVTAFLQKNNDSLQDSLLDLLDKSSNTFLLDIMGFQEDVSYSVMYL